VANGVFKRNVKIERNTPA